MSNNVISGLSVHTISRILDYLAPVQLWRVRSVSKLLRDAVDRCSATLFYPFAFLRTDQPTVVGTFSFSKQEALVLGLVQGLLLKVQYGKARTVTYPNADEVAQDVAAVLRDRSPTSALPELRQVDGILFEAPVYGREAPRQDCLLFLFSEDSLSLVLHDMKTRLSTLLGVSVSVSATLIPGGRLLKNSVGYKQNTNLLPQSERGLCSEAELACMQRYAHTFIMSHVAPAPLSLVPSVRGYNPMYGRGARVVSYNDARLLFGLKLSTWFEVDEGLVQTGRRNGRVERHYWKDLRPYHRLIEANGDTLSESSFTTSDVQRSVVLLSNATKYLNTIEAFTRCGGYLHVGASDDGPEAVVSVRDVASNAPMFSFSHEHSDSNLLYVTDNTYFAERYMEDMLLPTKFLRDVWARWKRSDGSEQAAPTIFGRPLSVPWILWGPPGTYSSPHIEPSRSCVWVHLVSGRKRWAVYDRLSGYWETFEQHAGSTVLLGTDIWHVVSNCGSDNFAIAQNYILPSAPEH